MLQAASPSHDWMCESEPLLFDDEFCLSLMKDLQSIPTPPQSPLVKPGLGKDMSSVDQLELVSDILMVDNDLLQLNWTFADEPLSGCLWRSGSDRAMEDKLSTSPLLSDIDTEIFAEIAGSTLDCHNVALACQVLESEDLPSDGPEQIESTSDYGSLSTGGESSASDSEEEIDVVTVRRSSAVTRSRHQQQQEELRRLHLEIQLQHNYAAPRPASPAPPPPARFKRSRGRGTVPLQTAEAEDGEERRKSHNVMERQRRNELKNCFLRLRDQVPELSSNHKASKVVILKRARDGIRSLEAENRRLARRRQELRERQRWLRATLERLQDP